MNDTENKYKKNDLKEKRGKSRPTMKRINGAAATGTSKWKSINDCRTSRGMKLAHPWRLY